MSITTSENGDVTLSKARYMVCLEASWELEAIAMMLPDAVANTDEDAFLSRLRVRSMAGRILQLANALMAGLSDNAVSVEGFGGLNTTVLLCDEVAQ